MNQQTARGNVRPSRSHRRVSLATGLLLALGSYAVLSFVIALGWRASFIGAWDIGASSAVALMYVRLRGSSAATIKQIAADTDVGKWWVLILSLAAASASLVVITSEMPIVKTVAGWEQALRVILIIYTVALSWGFIQIMCALHYAHDYYMAVGAGDAKAVARSKPIAFPGESAPTYGDFLYFSFTIGMTFQVSDVQIADPDVRRLVLAHAIVAFFYATGILAMAINLVAGLV